MNKYRNHLLTTVFFSAVFLANSAANAQAAPQAADQSSNVDASDIIVTAQKREQSINDVGLTIQAASGDALAQRGVASPADLTKIVAGFTYTESIFVTPVYTLRGIGLYDATFGSVPAVAIYTDQVSRNFPIMSDALGLDIERVEVLKGPQGTLFGQSATGGAINYIPAKPTEELKAGFDLSYERFGKLDASGFISGPLTDTLKVRAAARVVQGGAWQYSLSRPNDKNGDTRKLEGRFTADWQASDRLKFEASVTGARDHSDVQAGQYVGSIFNTYSAASLAQANANPATANPFGVVNDALYASLTTPGSPNFDGTFLGRQNTLVTRMNDTNPANAGLAAGSRALLGTPNAEGNARAADWTAGLLGPSHNRYFQGTLRGDYDVTDSITLTSITAYADKKINYATDLDATSARGVNIPINGRVRAFNQELRLSGEGRGFHWLIGGNFDQSKTRQYNIFDITDYSGNQPIPGFPPLTLTDLTYTSKLKTFAGFANGEYKIGDHLTISGGARYTRNIQTATHCGRDPLIDTAQGADAIFSIFQNAFTGQNLPPIMPDQCFDLGDGLNGTTFGKAELTPLHQKLSEGNWSYHAGIDYKFDGGTLAYATISQGYKAGIFSAISASSTSQFPPAIQEKVIAYEAGFKAPLFDRRVRFNGAVFYYDYSNKQVRGRVADAVFGLLEKLINVPKSYVWGLEGELSATPVAGLTMSASGTYLKSKVSETFDRTVDGSRVYNSAGYTGDFKGSPLPFTPKFSANADIQYEWLWNDQLKPFIGVSMAYQGAENTTFHNAILLADDYRVSPYATFDIRVGIGDEAGKWRVTAFGRNIFNKFYTTSITTYFDTRYRMTGRPATYGISLRFRT
jgi:iron complex outermembrane receptor protein